MPDANLKACIEELKPILRKYDCVGIVMLQSQTHAEFLVHLDPDWCIVKFIETPDGDRGIRIKAKRADYPSPEAHRKAVSLGTGVLMGFVDLLGFMKEQLESLVLVISEKAKITHWSKDENDPTKRFKIE
jgi:hypothetical protein